MGKKDNIIEHGILLKFSWKYRTVEKKKRKKKNTHAALHRTILKKKMTFTCMRF